MLILKLHRYLICLGILSLVFHNHAVSQNTYLDNSFNSSGYSIITNVPDHIDCQAADAALQDDGKLVLVGFGQRISQFRGDALIVRFNTNGSLDSTFGVNGILVSDFGSFFIEHNSIVIQPDGKLLVSGTNTLELTLYTPQSYTARYNPDGSFDSTFGNNGIVFFPESNAESRMWQSVLQTDGKLILAGSTQGFGNNEDLLLIRYNADGTLDESFDGDGFLITDVDNLFERANDITLQADGKIIIGGYHLTSENTDFLVMRYNIDGSIDHTFGTNGHTIIDLGGSDEVCNSVAVQPDGKIIAFGQTGGTSGQDFRFIVMRFNSNGSLDATFNGTGIVDAGINDHGEVYTKGIALRPDGKIVLGGSAELTNTSTKKFTILQLNPDGTRNQMFGIEGFVQVSISDLPDDERMMILDSEGKIIVAGFGQYLDNYVIAVARIFPELALGTLEFSTNSEVLIYPNPLQTKETLSYNLRKEELLSIGLYDIQGKLIQPILQNQKVLAGQHIIPFSIPPQLNSGVYFINLISSTGKISIKVIK